MKPALLLTVLWVAAVLAVDPRGEFPLNDDWASAWTVSELLRTGHFTPSDWAGMNILSQVWWGALFCIPFGFSFTALRVSTLVLGWAGLLSTFGILREAGASRMLAALGTLALAFNPIYLSLAHSFNSDIPSFAFSVISLFCLLRGLRLRSHWLLGAGLLVSAVSILNRESGLVILAGLAVAMVIRRGLHLGTIAIASVPLLAGLALNAAYVQWLTRHDIRPYLHGFQLTRVLETLSSGMPHAAMVYGPNLFVMATYFGLFTAPLMLVLLPAAVPRLKPRWLALTAVAAATAVGPLMLAVRGAMPYVGNVMTPTGIGPMTLEGYNVFLNEHDLHEVAIVWTFLTVVAGVSAVLLMLHIGRAVLSELPRLFSGTGRMWAMLFHLAVVAGYVAAMAAIPADGWFDRYLIFPVPMLMAAVILALGLDESWRVPRAAAIAGTVVVAALGWYSVAATHDFLASNRARWAAIHGLVDERAVPPAEISGGFEVAGWYLGQRIEVCNPGLRPLALRERSWDDFACLSQGRRRVVLAFSPLEGYFVERTLTFQRWLPRRRQRLYVLRSFELSP